MANRPYVTNKLLYFKFIFRFNIAPFDLAPFFSNFYILIKLDLNEKMKVEWSVLVLILISWAWTRQLITIFMPLNACYGQWLVQILFFYSHLLDWTDIQCAHILVHLMAFLCGDAQSHSKHLLIDFPFISLLQWITKQLFDKMPNLFCRVMLRVHRALFFIGTKMEYIWTPQRRPGESQFYPNINENQLDGVKV